MLLVVLRDGLELGTGLLHCRTQTLDLLPLPRVLEDVSVEPLADVPVYRVLLRVCVLHLAARAELERLGLALEGLSLLSCAACDVPTPRAA